MICPHCGREVPLGPDGKYHLIYKGGDYRHCEVCDREEREEQNK